MCIGRTPEILTSSLLSHILLQLDCFVMSMSGYCLLGEFWHSKLGTEARVEHRKGALDEEVAQSPSDPVWELTNDELTNNENRCAVVSYIKYSGYSNGSNSYYETFRHSPCSSGPARYGSMGCARGVSCVCIDTLRRCDEAEVEPSLSPAR